MILQINPSGSAKLLHPEDFKNLSCEVEAVQLKDIALALKDKVSFDGNVAWISVRWLRTLGLAQKDESWCESYDRMIAGAAKYGWVSTDGGLVRAHIVHREAVNIKGVD